MTRPMWENMTIFRDGKQYCVYHEEMKLEGELLSEFSFKGGDELITQVSIGVWSKDWSIEVIIIAFWTCKVTCAWNE